MKNQLITEIEQRMLKHLDNAQLMELRAVLDQVFSNVEITEAKEKRNDITNQALLADFLAAKRIEGCSEKSMRYYEKTITAALTAADKDVKHVTTEDLRVYFTEYQTTKKASKVTMDNIRRILSSFFSWLEDEDFIIKSPVRRIHKVKASKTIKETYTD